MGSLKSIIVGAVRGNQDSTRTMVMLGLVNMNPPSIKGTAAIKEKMPANCCDSCCVVPKAPTPPINTA